MDANRLIQELRRRGARDEFGYGLGTADRYLKQFADDVGMPVVRRTLQGLDLSRSLRKAKRQLVYSAPELVTELKATSPVEWEKMLPADLKVPAHTALVMKHIVTTPREDRDRDVLRTDGMRLDPKAPLLWQHIAQLILGKHLAVAEHTPEKLSSWTALLDLNDLTADAVKLIEADALRFSHGFRPLDWRERKDAAGDVFGFEITKAEIMEISLVSVPSNVDAEVELYSRGALQSDVFRAHAKAAFNRRKKNWRGIETVVKGAVLEALAEREPTGREGMPPAPAQVPPLAAPVENKGLVSGAAAGAADEPLRWNRSLSKSFDIERQHMEPSSLEYDWVSRYLSSEVKQVHRFQVGAYGARTASYLAYLDDELAEFEIVDVRNFTDGGRELPPVYEKMQLNSTVARDMLVDGTVFYRSPERLLVVKRESGWYGETITFFAAQKDREFANGVNERVWERCRRENPLKGEAFALSGEFLERGSTEWADVFLAPKNEAAIRRSVGLLASKGAAMPARGMAVMGPPGTGKTLTARLMMAKSAATFIWVSARDMYRTGSLGGFKMAFELARECAPAVIFFEDVDSWIHYRETIDLLKAEMDGLKSHKGTLTVLTTNHPEALPEALLDRPGRFHDVLEFGLPDKTIRAAMLRAWYPAASDEQREDVLARTEGWSGAHVRELCTYAGELAEAGDADATKALELALTKVEEQRELVAQRRTGYRPAKAIELGFARKLRELAADRTAEEPAGGAKAGRVLSAKNLAALKECRDDIAEMGDMDGMPRSATALCERIARRLDEIIAAAEPEPEEKAAGLELALAALDGAGLERIKRVVEGLLAVESRDAMAAELAALLNG